MIVDGRAIATEGLARTKERASMLARTPRVLAVVTSDTPATRSYLAIKTKRATEAGCALDIVQFREDTSTEILAAAVRSSDAEAVIVQLPLPQQVDTREVCNAIPASKDADVLSDAAREKFEKGDHDALLPPVVSAVREILENNRIPVKGKKAVVVGAGFLVGAPVATWLLQQGAHVHQVTIENSVEVKNLLGEADIIVSGAGSPHLIKPEVLKEGVVLIDAGTSESGSTISGDADPACVAKCLLFTPVPGGVGPLAVACLFDNAVTLTKKTTQTHTQSHSVRA